MYWFPQKNKTDYLIENKLKTVSIINGVQGRW